MKNKNTYLIILVFVLILSIMIVAISIKKKNQLNDEKNGVNIYLTTNYSSFFTVINCANKFISSVNNKDVTKTLNLLNKKYIKEKDINDNNVFDNVYTDINTNGEITYKIDKMYQKDYSRTSKRYYMSGNIYSISSSGNTKITDYYLMINIDYKNMTFDVIPFSGTEYKELINE